MNSVSFYRPEEPENNVCRMDVPLRVNCCGIAALQKPFTTANGQGRRDYYFLYMAEGTLLFGEKGHALQAGDAVIIPPETPYRYSLEQGEMAYYWVHFTGALAEALLKECGLPAGKIVHPGVDAAACEQLRQLHRAFMRRGAGFEAACAGHLAVIAARLAAAIEEGKSRAQTGRRLYASLEYLHAHYAEPIRLETLSALEYLSPSRYAALFRTSTGLSPQQYLIRLRMQTAFELVRTSDMSIHEIARAVGYEDQLYFSRLFRQRFGLSPRQLRGG